MKKMISMIFILCVFAVFAVGAIAQDNPDMFKYFPLNLGNKWIYAMSMTRGDELLEGDLLVNTAPGENPDDENEHLFESFFKGDMLDHVYYILKDDGLYPYKIVFKDKAAVLITIMFSPLRKLPILGNVELGKKYTTSHSVRFYAPDNFLIEEGTADIEVNIEGLEDVVVPAGKFENCLKVNSFTAIAAEKTVTSAKQVRWYAPGIGKVKEIEDVTKYGVEDRNSHTELELKSAVIDGVELFKSN